MVTKGLRHDGNSESDGIRAGSIQCPLTCNIHKLSCWTISARVMANGILTRYLAESQLFLIRNIDPTIYMHTPLWSRNIAGTNWISYKNWLLKRLQLSFSSNSSLTPFTLPLTPCLLPIYEKMIIHVTQQTQDSHLEFTWYKTTYYFKSILVIDLIYLYYHPSEHI